MFALPVLITLLFFVHIRPQELIEPLRIVPWLPLLFLGSWAAHGLDIKLSLVRPKPTPHFYWMMAFYSWAIVATALRAPHGVGTAIFDGFLFTTLGYICGHAITSFRALNAVAVGMLVPATLLILFGLHQGAQPKQCIKLTLAQATSSSGEATGEPCDTWRDCSKPRNMMCEQVGLFGASSIGNRLRYIGVLMDPNDYGLTLNMALPLLFAFLRQKPTAIRWFVSILLTLLYLPVLKGTGSRGAQLTFMAMLGMHFLWRFGFKASALAAAPTMPLGLVAILLKSGRDDAEESAQERIHCQWHALRMLRENPLTGVGYSQILEHFRLTAHNAYLLAPAELGYIGTYLWYGVSYTTFRLLLAVRNLTKDKPEARVAQIWSEALIASHVTLHIGIMFLSFNYHPIYWIYSGLASAVYKSTQSHIPSFEIPITKRDHIRHGTISAAVLGFWKLFIEYKYAKL
jgi:hypothetical protein